MHLNYCIVASTEAADKGKDPIDTYFLKLKCEMSILPRDTEVRSVFYKYFIYYYSIICVNILYYISHVLRWPGVGMGGR